VPSPSRGGDASVDLPLEVSEPVLHVHAAMVGGGVGQFCYLSLEGSTVCSRTHDSTSACR
jgi:hypothetical protein